MSRTDSVFRRIQTGMTVLVTSVVEILQFYRVGSTGTTEICLGEEQRNVLLEVGRGVFEIRNEGGTSQS